MCIDKNTIVSNPPANQADSIQAVLDDDVLLVLFAGQRFEGFSSI